MTGTHYRKCELLEFLVLIRNSILEDLLFLRIKRRNEDQHLLTNCHVGQESQDACVVKRVY